ncbi:MAG TPA: zinc ribbon domain-containing protein [Phycisphaerae bacterium]|nr:zinc ribbon domain-containing protein [Phycisphaerae bacterium]
MPTYEYACNACQHQFEEFQSITAKPIAVCPKCKKKKVKRLISGGAGFLFKGSGFYITDYRSDAYKAAAKGDSAPAATAAPAKTDAASTTPAAPAAPAASAKSESKPPRKK